MKLIYRHPVTGQRIAREFAAWPELLDAAWLAYFRSLDWPTKLDCICEAGCDAFDEVFDLSTLNSQNSQLLGS